jgi:hypothetical protein
MQDTTGTGMRHFVKAPIRAGRHLAIWLVWQSTGVSLVNRAEPPLGKQLALLTGECQRPLGPLP